jgi:hypothetical protein
LGSEFYPLMASVREPIWKTILPHVAVLSS